MWLHIPASCLSAPEAGVSTLDLESRSRLLEQSVTLNETLSPSQIWLRRLKKDSWLTHLFGAILEPSTASLGVERWITSLEESHALPPTHMSSQSKDTSQYLMYKLEIRCSHTEVDGEKLPQSCADKTFPLEKSVDKVFPPCKQLASILSIQGQGYDSGTTPSECTLGVSAPPIGSKPLTSAKVILSLKHFPLYDKTGILRSIGGLSVDTSLMDTESDVIKLAAATPSKPSKEEPSSHPRMTKALNLYNAFVPQDSIAPLLKKEPLRNTSSTTNLSTMNLDNSDDMLTARESQGNAWNLTLTSVAPYSKAISQETVLNKPDQKHYTNHHRPAKPCLSVLLCLPNDLMESLQASIGTIPLPKQLSKGGSSISDQDGYSECLEATGLLSSMASMAGNLFDAILRPISAKPFTISPSKTTNPTSPMVPSFIIASPTASPVEKVEPTTAATSGQTPSESSEKSDLMLSGWKTFQASFDISVNESGQTYEQWATELRRDYSRRLKSGHPTLGNAFSVSLIPSERVSESDNGQWMVKYVIRPNDQMPTSPTVNQAATLHTPGANMSVSQDGEWNGRYEEKDWAKWSSPAARDYKDRGCAQEDRPDAQRTLGRQVLNWPPLTARDGAARNFPTTAHRHYKDWDGAAKKSRPKNYNSYSHLDLTTTIDGHECSERCRRLNPLFASWLMGWPITWTLFPLDRIGSDLSAMELSHWWRRMRFAFLLTVPGLVETEA